MPPEESVGNIKSKLHMAGGGVTGYEGGFGER